MVFVVLGLELEMWSGVFVTCVGRSAGRQSVSHVISQCRENRDTWCELSRTSWVVYRNWRDIG